MKHHLKDLYNKNKRDFEVWNYLWLFCENNTIEFTFPELQARFNVPPSSLHRILNVYPEQWNYDKVYVELTKVAFKQHKVTFYPKGKKLEKSNVYTIYDELFNWLKSYYSDLDYEYSELNKHKRYVKVICNKLTLAMKKRGTEVTHELLKESFKYIFLNLPEWWKDNQMITLTLVSKHFTKILNQVKSTNGTGKKRDSYDKAANNVEGIDFDRLAQQ